MHAKSPHLDRMIALTAGFLGFLLTTAASARADDATVVLLVRHAEKASTPIDDPPLTPAGEQRAAALARIAQNAGVHAIFTSEALRTKLTVKPLAEAQKIEPAEVPAADVQGLADRIRRQHRGQSVLVAGHSNTVPKIIAALGGPDIGNIPDSEYDNLFVLYIPHEGPARLLRLRF